MRSSKSFNLARIAWSIWSRAATSSNDGAEQVLPRLDNPGVAGGRNGIEVLDPGNEDEGLGRRPQVTLALDRLAEDLREHVVGVMGVGPLQGQEIRFADDVEHEEVVALAQDLGPDTPGLLGDEDAAELVLRPSFASSTNWPVGAVADADCASSTTNVMCRISANRIGYNLAHMSIKIEFIPARRDAC